MKFSYQVTIKEFHLDSLGHVNNATYLALFEEARWELITHRGFGLKEVRERQQGPVILEVGLKFLKEIRLREVIQITCELEGYSGKIGRLKQQMFTSQNEVAADAVFTFGFFDLKSRRLIEPTPEWLSALGVSK